MMRRIIEDLQRRIALMVTKAVLISLDDSGAIQKMVVEGLKNDRRSNVDRYQEFGFSSNLPEGAEVIMVSRAGDRSHNIGIASEDRRYRPKNLTPGESQVYNQFGDYVHLHDNGTLEIKSSTKVLIDAPLVEMTGDLEVAGDVYVGGNIDVDGNIAAVGDIDADGNIAAVGNVTAGAAITATGAVTAGTSVNDSVGPVSAIRTAYNGHTHVDNTPGTTSGPTPTV